MKITAIELGMLRVPLKTPFKTALRTVETVEDVVVLIRTDSGNTGYGEAPATAVITGDTHGSIIEAIRHFIAPRLIGGTWSTSTTCARWCRPRWSATPAPRPRWRSRCTTCGRSCTVRRCTRCSAAATR